MLLCFGLELDCLYALLLRLEENLSIFIYLLSITQWNPSIIDIIIIFIKMMLLAFLLFRQGKTVLQAYS